MGISLDSKKIVINKFDFKNYMKEIIPSVSYLTHGIHPYTAKLIPQIPRHFIGKYTNTNDIVIDPFCGSGTTLLEAKLLERNSIGIDINPLAKLISEVKTTQINYKELDYTIHIIIKQLKRDSKKINIEFPNIDYWFCDSAQRELIKIKSTIESIKKDIDCNTHKFLLICFSSIIRKSSYADPRIAKIYKSNLIIEKIKNGWIPKPIEYFEDSISKNYRCLKALSEISVSDCNFTKVIHGDARNTSYLLNQNNIEKIDFILTSPPYINAQDYFRSYKLELWWLGLATPEEVKYLKHQSIGTEILSGNSYDYLLKDKMKSLNKICNKICKINKEKYRIIYKYFINMSLVFKELHKVLKKSGYLCLITGNNTICGIHIPTHKILSEIAENIGFKIVEIGRDEIKDRALPPIRNHKGGIIKEEWIIVFQKKE